MAGNCSCSINLNSQGGNMYFRGDWEFCPEYRSGDVVIFRGNLYLALKASAGKDPTINTEYWRLMNITPPTPPPTDRTIIDGGYATELNHEKYAAIKLRHDSAHNWEASNPRLELGEIGIEFGNPNRIKIGNGVDCWNELPYLDEATTAAIEALESKIEELEAVVEAKYNKSLDEFYLYAREREDFLQGQTDTLAEIAIKQQLDRKQAYSLIFGI